MTLLTFKRYADRIEGKIAFRAALAAGFAFLFENWYGHFTNRPEVLISGLYCIVAALIAIQANIGSTYKAASTQFFGVLVGSLMGGISTHFLGSSPLSLAFGIFCTLAICSLLQMKDNYRMAAVSVAGVMISWQLHPEISPWLFTFYRFTDSCLGIAIAMFVVHAVFPSRAVKQIRIQFARTCMKLHRLFQMIIAPEPNKEEIKVMEGEIETMMQKSRQALEDTKLEIGSESDEYQELHLMLGNFESLLETLMALRKVYHPEMRVVFDDPLLLQLQTVTQNIEIALTALASRFAREGNEQFPDLSLTLENLTRDLLRFRETYALRKFPLDVVENYFVTLYCLKRLLFLLERIDTRLQKLKS